MRNAQSACISLLAGDDVSNVVDGTFFIAFTKILKTNSSYCLCEDSSYCWLLCVTTCSASTSLEINFIMKVKIQFHCAFVEAWNLKVFVQFHYGFGFHNTEFVL